MPIYIVNNQKYNLPEEAVEGFLQQFPNAELLEDESVEKTEPVVETTAPATGRLTRSNVGDSQQVVGSSDSQKIRTTDESLNLLDNKPEEEKTAGEKMLTSLRNVPSQLSQAIPFINVGTDAVYRAIFGNEAIDNWNANEDIPDFFKITDEQLAEDRKSLLK